MGFFRKIFGANKRSDAVHSIEKKLGMKYSELPDILPINRETEKYIEDFKARYDWVKALNVNISKNDLMFMTSLWAVTLPKAYFAYLQTGLNGRNIIAKLVNKKFGSLNNLNSILDFASGYGRMTRFLVSEISPDKIWISDIKEMAVEFQKTEFGVNGLVSSFDPEQFRPEKNFDFIFVGSLFSHLPEKLFRGWLKSLYALLNDEGVIAFSVLPIEKHGSDAKGHFEYREVSEDIQFELIDDSIKKADAYGMAYVSEEFGKEVLSENDITPDQYYRYKDAFGTIQDIYVVTKGQNVFDESIDFSSYP